jgi:hypothetical protein
MSGTHLFYNGVLFRDVKTDEFIQEIESDESGTDPLYSRFRITCESFIVSLSSDLTEVNPTASQGHDSAARIPTPGSGDDEKEGAVDDRFMMDRLRIVQARLQERRKDFWLAVNGAAVLSNIATDAPRFYDPGAQNYPYRIVLAATGELFPGESALNKINISGFGETATNAPRLEHLDCNDGPKPKLLSASIIGGRALRVRFSIELCLCICRGLKSGEVPPVRDARKIKGVISNRWSISEDLDSQFRSTHTIEGTLIVSDHRYKVQAMRTMCHPKLFPYARLESRNFTQDKTGLKLGYRFGIKEQGDAPPKGLVDWEATYSESSAMGSGQQSGTMNIRVTGSVKRPPGMSAQTQKVFMIRAMFAILQSRITAMDPNWNQLPGNNPKGTIISEVVVTEQVGKPNMELRVIVKHSNAGAGVAMNQFNLRLQNMGAPIPIPGYSPAEWPMPDFFQWDTVGENAKTENANGGGSYFEQYYQTPCNLWHAMPRFAKTDKLSLAEPTAGEGLGEGVGLGAIGSTFIVG